MSALTEMELRLAKQALAKTQRERNPNLSAEDRQLLKKYPRHTLAEARAIDATPPSCTGEGYVSGFDRILAQERGNFHLGGNHT